MVPSRDSALGGPGVRVLLAGTGRHVTGSVLPEIPAVGNTIDDLATTFVEQCELNPANLRTVVDPADPAMLGQALVDTASAAERLLLFYFVGHGLVSSGGELHLATCATRDLTQGLAVYQGLPYSEVRTALADCRAQSIVVVLDCCYSGRARGSLGSVVDDAFTASQVRGGYLLTSAARNELALAIPGERYTVFTGALLDLLRHGDPTDKAAPLRLTLDYLHRRLERRLVERGFPRPYRQASDRAGELVLRGNPAWMPSQSRRDRNGQAHDGAESVICPYPGLEPFGREDAGWFFGRERLIQELLTLVTAGTGPVIVVGSSGSGKSSLLRAGLLASLASNGPQLLLTPTAHPVRELSTRLVQHSCAEFDGDVDADRIHSLIREVLGESPLLLVVDQFEELFTACSDEREREAFVAVLAALGTPEEGRIEPLAVVVLGVRADFYGHLTAYPFLVEALRIRQLVVGPMSSDEVHSAIEKPADAVGLALEQGLVDLVLRDLGSVHPTSTDVSPLPFLSHALRATWERREGRLLTLTGYQATGGIWDAVRSTADATYDGLDPDDQGRARRLLLRMVRIGEGTEHTRRRLVVDELGGGLTPSSSIIRVLRRLADARLVTVDKDTTDGEVPVTAEISHEALIRGWPRLTSWIEADRAELVTRQHLSEAAEAWQRAGQDSSMLYQGLRLTSARQLVESPRRGELTAVELTSVELTSVERSFLDASERRARRTTRRLRQTVAILATSLLVAVTAGGVGVYQWRAAVHEQRNAVAQQIATQAHALLSSQPWVSMMLDAQSLQFNPTQQARADLINALLTQPRRVATLEADSTKFRQIAFHPRRPLLLTQDYYGDTKFWDTASRAMVGTITGGVGRSVKFSPDGRLLATVGGKSAVLWNLDEPTRPKRVAVLPDNQGEGEAWSVAFAANGQSLAVVHKGDRTVLWDIRDPALPRWLSSVATRGPDQDSSELGEGAAVFSPDGRTLATGSWGTTVLWDVSDLAAPHRLVTVDLGDVRDDGNLAFSSDGRMLAIAGEYPRSMLGAEGKTHILDVIGLITEIRVNQDLKARYGDLKILDDPILGDHYLTRRHVTTLSTPGIIGNLLGRTITFSPTDPKVVAIAESDGRTYLWNLANPAEPRRTAILTGGVIDSTSHNATFDTAVAFSSDGRTLATINSGGAEGNTSLSLWDLNWAQSNKIATIPGSAGRATAVNPNGKTLATVEESGTTILWDISNPARPTKLAIVPSSDVTALAFSYSGNTLITGGNRSSILWDVRNPVQPARRAELAASATAVSFNPTGEIVATAGSKLTLWDTQTGTEHKFSNILINELYEATGAILAFHPKRYILATVDDKRLLVWVYTGDPSGDPEIRTSVANRSLTGGTGTGANQALFSPNGETLLTITGYQAVLWDTRTPTNPTRLAELEPTQLNAAAFGPDGNLMATSGATSTTLWNTTQPNQPVPVATAPAGVGTRTGLNSALTFVPGGQAIAIATAQGVELWSVAHVTKLLSTSTDQLIAQACAIAGPGLSEQDWNAYLPSLTHRQICP